MPNLFNVEGKTAIITGGMGQLGSQYTRVLLENGAKAAIFDINIHKKSVYLASVAKHERLRFYQTDITRKQSLKSSLEKAIRDLGQPAILINNAALDVPPGFKGDSGGAFEDYPESCWDKTCAVNLKGAFLVCQAVGSFMAKITEEHHQYFFNIRQCLSGPEDVCLSGKKGKPFLSR